MTTLGESAAMALSLFVAITFVLSCAGAAMAGCRHPHLRALASRSDKLFVPLAWALGFLSLGLIALALALTAFRGAAEMASDAASFIREASGFIRGLRG